MSLKEFDYRTELFTKVMNNLPAKESSLHLVRHVQDPYLKATLYACIMQQNQYKHDKNFPEFLKMAVLPTMVHSLMSIPLDVFSIQPYDSEPCDGTYYFAKAGDKDSIKKLATKITTRPNIQMSDLSAMSEDEIIERILDIACSLAQDLVQHGLTQILKEVTKVNLPFPKEEKGMLDGLILNSEEMHEEIGRSPNFILMDMEMAKALSGSMQTFYDFDSLPINLRGIGYLKNRWKVYVCSGLGGSMIMGYRGYHPADAGLIFQPLDLFHKPKKVLMPKANVNGYAFSFQGAMTITRKDYFRIINWKPDQNESYYAEGF